MELDLKSAAALMAVPEEMIYRWIHDLGMPGHRVNEQYRFNRAELLEWATAQGIRISPMLFSAPDASGLQPFTFSAALAAGGIHYDVPGADKREALEAAIGLMPLPEETDRDLLLDVILARESLGSTGIGDGIAIPHVRNPIVVSMSQPVVTLCFLATPVDFDAVDGKPVHTLFTIVSPQVKSHLNLLARLAFALRQPAFAEVIARRGSCEQVVAAARLADAGSVGTGARL